MSNPFDPRIKQGLSRRGANALGSPLTSPGAKQAQMLQTPQTQPQQMQQPPPQPQPPPWLRAMQPAPIMGGGAMMPASMPLSLGKPQSTPMEPQRWNPLAEWTAKENQTDKVDPNMKAIMDAMTGARVHKDMSGRQIGMQGVDPNLQYMLYAMRGRRHKSMGNKDIY